MNTALTLECEGRIQDFAARMGRAGGVSQVFVAMNHGPGGRARLYLACRFDGHEFAAHGEIVDPWGEIRGTLSPRPDCDRIVAEMFRPTLAFEAAFCS